MIIEKPGAGNAEPRRRDIIGNQPAIVVGRGQQQRRAGLGNANSGEVVYGISTAAKVNYSEVGKNK